MSHNLNRFEHNLVPLPPPPPKFTLEEWQLTKNHLLRCATQQQQLTDSVLAEGDRLIALSAENAKSNKDKSDQLLKERQDEIEFCNIEIGRQRKEVCIELDALLTYIERIIDSLKQLEKNKEIVEKCYIFREHRIGIDLCEDLIDRQLKKEIDVINGAEQLQQRLLEQTNEQIRRLRSTLYFIDRDLESKGTVLKIDVNNLILKETSLNLSIYHGFAPLDPSNVVNEEWQQYTDINILTSAKEIHCGRQLRSYVNSILEQVNKDLREQRQTVDEAFRKRIEEVKEIKTKLEVQHSEVSRQVNEISITITRLEKAIAEKEGFMALAHTRLGNRAQRAGIELCKDQAGINLMNELDCLRLNINEMQNMLIEAQAAQRYLLKVQLQIEEDLNVKTNTLKIDEVDCMCLRQSMGSFTY